MTERIVIDTGPLIAFFRMDALDIIGQLPFEFICPAEIEKELIDGVARGHPDISPVWLRVVPLGLPLSPVHVGSLDEGEAAVIQLAVELGGLRVSIDELQGRKAAGALGLK